MFSSLSDGLTVPDCLCLGKSYKSSDMYMLEEQTVLNHQPECCSTVGTSSVLVLVQFRLNLQVYVRFCVVVISHLKVRRTVIVDCDGYVPHPSQSRYIHTIIQCKPTSSVGMASTHLEN
jgi:hypothetical protein